MPGKVVLSADQLNPTDRDVLDLLAEGRVTAPFAAEELGLSNDYVRNRLIRLAEHGHVENLHGGLYELVDDPREGT